MSEAKTVKINGTDFTSIIPPVGYQVGTNHVYGGNAMTMQSGGKYKDEVANLAVVIIPFMPVTEAQHSALVQTLLSASTCSLYYYDPDVEAYRTIKANRTISKRKYKGRGADDNKYFSGLVVTFEETI